MALLELYVLVEFQSLNMLLRLVRCINKRTAKQGVTNQLPRYYLLKWKNHKIGLFHHYFYCAQLTVSCCHLVAVLSKVELIFHSKSLFISLVQIKNVKSLKYHERVYQNQKNLPHIDSSRFPPTFMNIQMVVLSQWRVDLGVNIF